MNPTERNIKSLLAVVVVLGLALLAPPAASASFTRPFLRSITRSENTVSGTLNTTPCSEAERALPGTPCLLPDGIAVDGKDDLWVESAQESLAGFAPAYPPSENTFVEQLPKPPAKPPLEGLDFLQHLAVEDGSEDFYVTGDTHSHSAGSVVVYNHEGKLLREWEKSPGEPFRFQGATVTVDNAPLSVEDPSGCALGECSVYVTETGENGGIMRFDSAGHPVPFEGCEEAGKPCPYVQGSKITGIPGQPKGVFQAQGLNAVAVDSRGDIYADNNTLNAVYEYAPSGEFIHSFDLASEEVPRLPGGHVGSAAGLAVDPVSGHLLVSLVGVSGGESVGAVDEFDIEGAEAGKFVTEITETSEGTQLQDPRGLSVDSLGDLYVLDAGRDAVDSYKHGAYYPTVTLGAATKRTSTAAVLTGVVNPAQLGNKPPASVTECYFQYVSEAAYDESESKKEGGFSNLESGGSKECAPKAGEIAADEKDHEVQAKIEGLKEGVTYRYRLVASTDPAKLGGKAETAALAFTAPAAPEVLSPSASNLSSTFADLEARIRPRGASTSYRFEYDTRPYAKGEAGHGQVVPVPDAAIGAGGPTGGAAESVLQHVGPLAPSTTYYFRVVATNEVAVEDRVGGMFATLPAAPPGAEGRGYELVTPATKEGGSDMFAKPETNGQFKNNDDGTPAESGDGFLLETFSAFGPFPGAFGSAYVFSRHPVAGDPEREEWSYRSLAEPALGVQTVGEGLLSDAVVFDPADLSRVAVNDEVGSGKSAAGAQQQSLLGEPGGPYTLLHADPAYHGRVGLYNRTEITQVVGSSRDLSHVVLESEVTPLGIAPVGQTDKACPGAEGVEAGAALCEWAGGALKLIDVKPESESEPVSKCGARLGASFTRIRGTYHAVSADGSRVFFTAPDPVEGSYQYGRSGPGCWKPTATAESHEEVYEALAANAPQVYARIDGAATLKLSEPEEGVTEGGKKRPAQYPAEFVGASEDGSEVFFVTGTWLTENHPEGHDPELYECQIVEVEVGEPKCNLTRISAGVKGEPGESEGAQLLGVQAVAGEGTAVYFLAYGALAPGASKLQVNRKRGSGAPVNLYRYQTQTATTPAQTTYIATVSNNLSSQPSCDRVGWAPCLDEENWYTTPDGRYLLFYSEVDLTANAHAGGTCEVPGSQGLHGTCGVLYRYDAQAAEADQQPLVCVSCNPDGGVTGDGSTAAAVAAPTEFARSAPPGPASSPVRAISNDGSYVFFDSPEALVPGATNNTLDVYQWHEGRISLLGSGSEAGPSYFLGYSPNPAAHTEQAREGGNVFIGTHAKLVPADTNSVGNIYDARVCEPESPCIEPPTGETAQCLGDTCQTPPPSPLFQTPATNTLSSSGNIAPELSPPTVTKKSAPKCKKPKKLTHGKCVKPKTKKRKAKKSNHSKGSH